MARLTDHDTASGSSSRRQGLAEQGVDGGRRQTVDEDGQSSVARMPGGSGSRRFAAPGLAGARGPRSDGGEIAPEHASRECEAGT